MNFATKVGFAEIYLQNLTWVDIKWLPLYQRVVWRPDPISTLRAKNRVWYNSYSEVVQGFEIPAPPIRLQNAHNAAKDE